MTSSAPPPVCRALHRDREDRPHRGWTLLWVGRVLVPAGVPVPLAVWLKPICALIKDSQPSEVIQRTSARRRVGDIRDDASHRWRATSALVLVFARRWHWEEVG
jgi:hypothetical protein